MKIEDLNKQQIILLAILVTFVSSIATGITVVTLMQQNPQTIATPINRIIRQTVQYVAPTETGDISAGKEAVLSSEETILLNQMKTVGSFVPIVFLVNENGEKQNIANGLFLGENKIVVSPPLPVLNAGQSYLVQSVFGKQSVIKNTSNKEYSILELKIVEAQEEEVDGGDTAPVPELPPTEENL